MPRIFKEQSEVTVVAVPKDVNNEAYIPTTARYRVDDCTTKQAMVAWTDLTPSAAMTITIPGTANTIINDCSRTEEKTVTVQLDQGLSSQQNGDYRYKIKNLRFIS